jgi:hypothetical protein
MDSCIPKEEEEEEEEEEESLLQHIFASQGLRSALLIFFS